MRRCNSLVNSDPPTENQISPNLQGGPIAPAEIERVRNAIGDSVIFTVATSNYMPRVSLLAESLNEATGGSSSSVVWVVPDMYAACTATLSGPGIHPIGVADDLCTEFAGQQLILWSPEEIATILKPQVFCQLLGSFAFVTYLDPDMFVVDNFLPEMSALEGSAVFTPHLIGPSEYSPLRATDVARVGSFNLGFASLRATSDGVALSQWWASRVIDACFRGQEEGVFLDQRWIDQAPALFDGVRAWRDPSMNCAWWNLSHRDSRKCRLFHFSGFDPSLLPLITRHASALSVDDLDSGWRMLFDHYSSSLLSIAEDWDRKRNDPNMTPIRCISPSDSVVLRAATRGGSVSEDSISQAITNLARQACRNRLSPSKDDVAGMLDSLRSELEVFAQFTPESTHLESSPDEPQASECELRTASLPERCSCGLPKPGRFY